MPTLISSEEDHRPKTIDGHEVIGLEPDDPCTYCGERDGTVYLIRNTYKGLSEPMHESCAVAWFGWLRGKKEAATAKSDPIRAQHYAIRCATPIMLGTYAFSQLISENRDRKNGRLW